MGNGTVSENITHVTPHGNELRAEVVYDKNGPQVERLQVVDPHTGTIKTLDEKLALDMRDLLQANQLKERAMGDVAALESNFKLLAERLGVDSPHIAEPMNELKRLREFVDVAEHRGEILSSRLDRAADKAFEDGNSNRHLPNLKGSGPREV